VNSALAQLDIRFPGFLEFYSRLLGYYFAACPRKHPQVAARMAEALDALEEQGERALQEFARGGIFADGALSSREQVELFWKSPLMALFEAAIGYTPPPGTDLSLHLPKPVGGFMELVRRRQEVAQRVVDGALARGELPYWQACLTNCAPELYLLPYLPERGSLVGLDLGCGWGRGTLSLPELNRLQVHAFDVNENQLSVMRSLARNLHWQGLRTKASAEPIGADDFADFGVSTAFLHLLEEAQLTETLRALLRLLKRRSPLYLEVPTRSSEGVTMVTQFSGQELIDRLHSVECNDKIFQLVEHDPRIPDLFTFGVLDKHELPAEPRTGRRAFRHRTKARAVCRHSASRW